MQKKLNRREERRGKKNEVLGTGTPKSDLKINSYVVDQIKRIGGKKELVPP